MGEALKIGTIDLELIRKPIKHLHISVLPPKGAVRVSVPEKMSDTAIRMAVVRRIPWIKKQQNAFISQPRQSSREMVSGETHYLWGRPYRLEVVERFGKHEICLKGKSKLHLYANKNTTLQSKLALLDSFYRAELKKHIPELIQKWQPIIKESVADVRVQKMKTKWGSCAIENKRILINSELAKKPPECLEYVIVHEMIHLIERKHNERFLGLLDLYLPNWRESKALLSNTVIADLN